MSVIKYAQLRIDFFLEVLAREFNHKPRARSDDRSKVQAYIDTKGSSMTRSSTMFTDDFWRNFNIDTSTAGDALREELAIYDAGLAMLMENQTLR